MSTSTLSEQVSDVLIRSTITGNSLTLPPGQLDRKLYVEVNDALLRLGGKWDRKSKAHVFPNDPSERIAELLDGGEIPERNPLAYFPTPPAVVERMVAMTENGARGYILEPSAGDGAIVRVLAEQGDETTLVQAVEMDEARYNALQSLATPDGVLTWQGDFLRWRQPRRLAFDAVYMNPPFALKTDKLAYIPHIKHAFSMLKPGGELVAVAPSGVVARQDKRVREFRGIVEQYGRIEELPGGSFEGSGTGVNSVLIYMRKPEAVSEVAEAA